jgi:phosphatidylglycerophosphate synthase
VVTIRVGVGISLAALGVLLAVLDATVGLGLAGWATGLIVGSVLGVAVARIASRERVGTFGPADLVTLARATMSCGIAAWVADSFLQHTAQEGGAVTVVVLAVVALATDAVDGRVARRTGTESRFGGRLDGEADAFLMLVLSVYVAPSAGTWVLAIGSLRYLFGAAGWLLPWMRAQLPARYWRKVVTATSGIALTFAAADVAPPAVTDLVLVVALVLLIESFGRDVSWLWRHRSVEICEPGPQSTPVRRSSP